MISPTTYFKGCSAGRHWWKFYDLSSGWLLLYELRKKAIQIAWALINHLILPLATQYQLQQKFYILNFKIKIELSNPFAYNSNTGHELEVMFDVNVQCLWCLSLPVTNNSQWILKETIQKIHTTCLEFPCNLGN